MFDLDLSYVSVRILKAGTLCGCGCKHSMYFLVSEVVKLPQSVSPVFKWLETKQ